MSYKAYKFRLHPNATQERELEIMLESHRRLYNEALAQREWFWQEWQISRTYQDQSGWFTALFKSIEGRRWASNA
jgi:putative transposase